MRGIDLNFPGSSSIKSMPWHHFFYQLVSKFKIVIYLMLRSQALGLLHRGVNTSLPSSVLVHALHAPVTREVSLHVDMDSMGIPTTEAILTSLQPLGVQYCLLS